MKNKDIVFKAKNKDGEVLELTAKKPTIEQIRELQLIYNAAVAKAITTDSNILLQDQIEEIAKKRGLWGDEKVKKEKEIDKKIVELTTKLLRGGKLADGKKTALEIIKTRRERMLLRQPLSSLESLTAESLGTVERMNHAVVKCLVYTNTETPVFVDVKEYLDRADEEFATEGAKWVSYLLFNLDPDFDKKLPEYQFLLKHKFVNDKLQFINKDGKPVDEDGKPVREDGRYINDKNELVNVHGQQVDEDGNLIVNFGEYTE